MKKMEKHKKRDHNKTSFPSLPLNSKLKRCYTEMVPLNDEERVQHYLKIREQKLNQTKNYPPKTFNIVKREFTLPTVQQINGDKVISLNSDMKLDKSLMKNKNHSTASTNKNNDRLVIELKDYLTLTKYKKIAKFKLKPIFDKPELSSVKDIISTANTFQFNQILNYGESDQEPQRTFLLVPHNKADAVNKESKLHKKQVNRKKSEVELSSELISPVETRRKPKQSNRKQPSILLSNVQKNSIVETVPQPEQSNHKQLSILLSNVQKHSINNVSVKTDDIKYSEIKIELPEEESSPVIRPSKKVQSSNKQKQTNVHSNTSDAIKPLAKKEKKVILRSHPYFSKHKPFVIKHTPAVTNVTTTDNDSVTIQQESLEIDLDSVFKSELIDDIKFELPEHELNFMLSEDGESINQIFPVALKSTDSDDFEYLGFETTEEIPTEETEESDMQILGI